MKDKTLTATKELSVYPNPTRGMINIDFPNNEGEVHQVSITDKFGRVIVAKRMNSEKKQLWIGGDSGYYLVHILNNKSGKIETKKIYLTK